MNKWHIIIIVAVAVILGIWFVPIVPTDEGLKTVPQFIGGGGGRGAREQ